MTWTTSKPTVPGWYWWRRHGKVRVVEIVEVGEEDEADLEVQGDALAFSLKLLTHGDWAGPLEAPQ